MPSGTSSLVLIFLILGAFNCVQAQERVYDDLGRTPTQQEIQDWDIAVGPDGDELPEGSGNARAGENIYMQRCAACHGADLHGGPAAPELVGGQETIGTLEPMKSVGAYWPFATTIWDFIYRAMPPNNYNIPIEPSQRLSPDDVYSLTAFILYKNDIIQENVIMDKNSLPKVKMPNRNGFVPVDLEDTLDYRGRGCRAGTCP